MSKLKRAKVTSFLRGKCHGLQHKVQWPWLQAPHVSKRQSFSSSKTPIQGLKGKDTCKNGKMD